VQQYLRQIHSLFGRTDTVGTPFAKYSARIYVRICSVAKMAFTLLCLDCCVQLERCNPWPHVANCHVSISQLLSLWRHSHYDFSCLWNSQPPFSLWRHLLLSWPRPLLRTYHCTDTLPRSINKDYFNFHNRILASQCSFHLYWCRF